MTSNNVGVAVSLPVQPPPSFQPAPINTYQELFFRKACRPSLWEKRTGKQLAASVFVHLVLLCGVVLLIYKIFVSLTETEKNAKSSKKAKEEYDEAERVRIKAEKAARVAKIKAEKEARRLEIVKYELNPQHFVPVFNIAGIPLSDPLFHPGQRDAFLENPGKANPKFVQVVRDLKNGNLKCAIGDFNAHDLQILNLYMLAIFNKLQGMQNQPHYEQLFLSITFQIVDSLGHCTNHVNQAIQRAFNAVCSPKDGSLGHRIKQVLQDRRDTCFQAAIKQLLNSYFAGGDEASTVNYYTPRMSKEFGLPNLITDSNYNGCARKNEEPAIRAYFESLYNPETIVEQLIEIIRNPWDDIIKCDEFNKWVGENYTINEQFEILEKDMMNYNVQPYLKLLVQIGVLQPKKK